ncbi:MAG: succinate dehydrogenase, cytochrome b556 subunit [Oceanococcaceae bacterium]
MAIDTQGRPLSPHLQVYRWQLPMALSILHRATGVGNAIGAIGLVCWLLAAAQGPEAYATVQSFYASGLGQLMLLAWSFSLYYHMCNGIRHLVWDTGRALHISKVYRGGIIMLCCAGGLTLLTWLSVWF